MEKIRLEAPEGKMLTDGVVYGKVIVFKEGTDKPENYYEIAEEEYNEIQAKLESESEGVVT